MILCYSIVKPDTVQPFSVQEATRFASSESLSVIVILNDKVFEFVFVVFEAAVRIDFIESYVSLELDENETDTFIEPDSVTS